MIFGYVHVLVLLTGPYSITTLKTVSDSNSSAQKLVTSNFSLALKFFSFLGEFGSFSEYIGSCSFMGIFFSKTFISIFIFELCLKKSATVKKNKKNQLHLSTVLHSLQKQVNWSALQVKLLVSICKGTLDWNGLKD